MATFFVSCPLGFEEALEIEMHEFWFELLDLDGQPTRKKLSDYRKFSGGIEIEVEEHLGFQINFFSKLANRVLLRIAHFEARYFDQLEREFKKLDLNQWLDSQQPGLILKIESHKSRLNNNKSIEQALSQVLSSKGFRLSTESELAKGEASQIVFIRIEKDNVTVSLDTSGQHLHRRGYAQFRGPAPMREVLAAYLIQQLLRTHSVSPILAKKSSCVFLDPFVGSGTLLFEAQSQTRPNFNRFYSWQSFKNRPKIFKSPTWLQNYKWLQAPLASTCIGIDRDEKVLQYLKQNEIEFNKIFPGTASAIHTMCGDSLAIDLSSLRSYTGIHVISNPPYGHRLQESGSSSAVAVFERLDRELDLRSITLVHPEAWQFNFSKKKRVVYTDFSNQGLKLKLSVFR